MSRAVALIPILEEAGVRLRPMNRMNRRPSSSTYIGDCPRCGTRDTLFVERPGTRLMTTCCNEQGGLLAVFRLVLR